MVPDPDPKVWPLVPQPHSSAAVSVTDSGPPRLTSMWNAPAPACALQLQGQAPRRHRRRVADSKRIISGNQSNKISIVQIVKCARQACPTRPQATDVARVCVVSYGPPALCSSRCAAPKHRDDPSSARPGGLRVWGGVGAGCRAGSCRISGSRLRNTRGVVRGLVD
jgi:hypothetical protein